MLNWLRQRLQRRRRGPHFVMVHYPAGSRVWPPAGQGRGVKHPPLQDADGAPVVPTTSDGAAGAAQGPTAEELANYVPRSRRNSIYFKPRP